MRTLAQIISLTVVGRALKPRGGLKGLHKRHLLLKKRISCNSLPSSASFPEDPQVSSRFSSKSPSSLSNVLPVGGDFQVPAPAWALAASSLLDNPIHVSHLPPALSVSRAGCRHSSCRCVHNFCPVQLF